MADTSTERVLACFHRLQKLDLVSTSAATVLICLESKRPWCEKAYGWNMSIRVGKVLMGDR